MPPVARELAAGPCTGAGELAGRMPDGRADDTGFVSDDPIGIAHLDQHWGKRQRTRGPLPSVAVADGTLRYVRADELGRAVEQLFDARVDPAELHDRAEEMPDELARLREVADAYLQARPPWGESPTREISELELNQLRALGYAIP